MSVTAKVKNIPWKEFLIKQLVKIFGIVFIILMLLFIIQLSTELVPNRDEINPENVIGFDSSTYILLIVSSSTLFVFIVLAFTKLILVDNHEEFGIKSYKSWKSILIFLLVINFIAAVYVILDSALVNIFLVIGPVDLLWILDNNFGISLPSVTLETNRLAYAQIRSLWFFGSYIIMIIFPILMFIAILTRIGRSELFEKEVKETSERSKIKQITTIFIFLFTPVFEVFLVFLYFSISNNPIFSSFIFLFALGLAGWWLYQLFLLIFKTVKFTAWFSYANFLLVFPIIFLFYILPVLLWTGWDLIKIFLSSGSVTETIHDHIIQSDLHNQILNVGSMGIPDLISLVIKTLVFNATPFEHSIYRIFQLDFVIIVGLSAIIIGLAEGYSIVAIVKALTKGASIARTGKVASTSAPKLIVLTSRLLMLSVWLSLIWDKFLALYTFVKEEFVNIILPDFPYLPIISYLFQFTNELIKLSGFLLPLAVLFIPLFVILMSSFKFLSVTLVIEKFKSDTQVFFLLISSAFVLITTQILQDITDSFVNNSEQIAYMPFAFATTGNLLPWASKVFENLEAIAFYIGVFIAVYVGIKSIIEYLKNRKKKKKEETLVKKFEEIKQQIPEKNNFEKNNLY